MKARLFSIIKVGISLAFLGLLFYLKKDSIGPITDALKGMDKGALLLSSALYFASIFIFAARLKVLLGGQGFSVRYTETAGLTFIGLFFNNFLPTAIGGDVVKGYYTYKKTGSKLSSVISVFMDRFTGFLSLFTLGSISLIFCYQIIQNKALAWTTIAILLFLLFVLALFLSKKLARIFLPLTGLLARFKIKESVKSGYEAINAYKNKKGVILRAVLISIAAQITCFSVMFVLINGMGKTIPMKMVLLLMPLVSIISMLPSINGLGIRESAIYFLFGPYVGYENAIALSLLWLFMLLSASLVGAISYLFGAQYRPDKNKNLRI